MACVVGLLRRGLAHSRLVNSPRIIASLSNGYAHQQRSFAVPNLLHCSQMKSFATEAATHTPAISDEESTLPLGNAIAEPRTFTVKVHNVRVAPKKLNFLTKLVSLGTRDDLKTSLPLLSLFKSTNSVVNNGESMCGHKSPHQVPLHGRMRITLICSSINTIRV